MAFDINKYDDVNFHDDELTNKRIIALMLWFEFEIHEKQLDPVRQVLLLETLIQGLIKKEWYEIAKIFTDLRDGLLNK